MNIIELAERSGLKMLLEIGGMDKCLEHFAALVAAHEREECAKLFETITKDPAVPPVHFLLADTAKLIRARNNT